MKVWYLDPAYLVALQLGELACSQEAGSELS